LNKILAKQFVLFVHLKDIPKTKAMKKITLFTLSILNCLIYQKAISQNHGAISENAIWITYYQIGAPPTDYWNIYKTGTDTVIKGMKYIKLFAAPVNQTGAFLYSQDGPFTYSWSFRNDTNNRAYIFPANDTIEHLWYDFNLAVGDTLPDNQGWYSTKYLQPHSNVIVTSIDSAIYCNAYHKRYRFNAYPQFPDLVMGIGFTGDLIDNNVIYFEEMVSLSFYSSDTSMSQCSVTFTGMGNYTDKISSIIIYPNPNNGIFQVTSIHYPASSIEIYNVLGEKVYTTTNRKLLTTNKIDISAFPGGVYVVEVRTEKGVEVRKFVKK
jgi:hypothetical protein